MDWTQMATIIGTTTVPIVGVVIGLFAYLKKDMNTINAHHREDIKEIRAEIKEMRAGFAKVYELWSDLARIVYKGKK